MREMSFRGTLLGHFTSLRLHRLIVFRVKYLSYRSTKVTENVLQFAQEPYINPL